MDLGIGVVKHIMTYIAQWFSLFCTQNCMDDAWTALIQQSMKLILLAVYRFSTWWNTDYPIFCTVATAR